MKYKFIVDENIIYCAIRGVDEHDEKDTSSARFLANLLKNCHKIYLDKECNSRFQKNILPKIERISNIESVLPGMDLLIQEIVHTQEKIIWDFSDSMQLPDEENIPRKDLYIARCANRFSARIVTLDREFREKINTHAYLKKNVVTALKPEEAIPLVMEK